MRKDYGIEFTFNFSLFIRGYIDTSSREHHRWINHNSVDTSLGSLKSITYINSSQAYLKIALIEL